MADVNKHHEKKFRPIKTKLILAVIGVSTFFTLIIVISNFYIQYDRDVRSLDEKITQIKDSSISSITRAVWNLDMPYLDVQIDSIANIKDVVKVQITDPKGDVLIEKFNDKSQGHDDKRIYAEVTDLRVYKYALHHKNFENYFLGNVEIIATTKDIRTEIYKRQMVLIAGEIVRNIFLSFLLIIIINHYINKNIEQIIEFLKRFNLNSVEPSFLEIKRQKATEDEIDVLEHAINKMIQKINFLNKEKELKISDQEKKIEMQQIAAISSAKMAALGEMAAGIAHEINNPLTIINTNAKIIEKVIEKGIENKDLLMKSSTNIVSTVERIGSIVSGLKNISRDASNDKMSQVPLAAILTDVISLCQERLKNNHIEIHCNLEDPIFLTNLNCFQVQLCQVFLNLFNNSFDAIRHLPSKWIRIDATRDENWMIIHFMDSGPGIPEELREKIFQPFFTSKEIGEGTGLGLSLVYAIVKNHNGEIYYDPQFNNTCFTIKLPIAG